MKAQPIASTPTSKGPQKSAGKRESVGDIGCTTQTIHSERQNGDGGIEMTQSSRSALKRHSK